MTPLDAVTLFAEPALDLSPRDPLSEAELLYTFLLVISIEHPPR